MADQQQIRATSQEENEQEQVSIASTHQEVNQGLVQDADDLLAEIDGLLEENAEEFVKSFVQKGGE